MEAERRGEIHDIGYQRYEGPREGRRRTLIALWTDGMRTALGLGRGTKAKILPVLLFASAILPAAILVIVASMSSGPLVPGTASNHAIYDGIVLMLVLLFSAIIAPELLCADRRSQVLQLYLVRPLSPADYLAGRWLAFFTILLALVYFGQSVLFVGLTLNAEEPLTYIRENWLDVPRFLAAGAIASVFATTIPLAVAGFASRRAYAAVFVIGLIFISSAVANPLVACTERQTHMEGNVVVLDRCEPITGEYAKWIGLLDLGSVPGHVNGKILGSVEPSDLSLQVEEFPAAVPIAWYLVLTVGPALLLLRRYQRIA